MSNTISGILFDVGGVLVRMNGVPSMAKLLDIKPDHEELHALWLTSPSVVAHETGKITAEEFAIGVVADLNLPVSADDFLKNFCDWPEDLLPGALQLLEDVPSGFQLAALSNTSEVHWDKILTFGLGEHFEQTYLSHLIGHLKPSYEAYQMAIEGMCLAASEILFLDDGARNIEAAKKLGMRAHLVKSPKEARLVLEEYMVLRENTTPNNNI